jgi:hypothetical protein
MRSVTGRVAPGWYVDPLDEETVRYWDGEFWTPVCAPVRSRVNWPARFGLGGGLAVAIWLWFAGAGPITFWAGVCLGALALGLGVVGLGARYGGSGRGLAIATVVVGLLTILGCVASLWIAYALSGGGFPGEEYAGDGVLAEEYLAEEHQGDEYPGEEHPEEGDSGRGLEVPQGWRGATFDEFAVGLPSSWGYVEIEGEGYRVEGLDLPQKLESTLVADMRDMLDEVMFVDQASVDRLREVPRADRTGEWREDRIEDLWMEYHDDDGGRTVEDLLNEARELSEGDPEHVGVWVFDHPRAAAVYSEDRFTEDGIDWSCRWYDFSFRTGIVASGSAFGYACRNLDDPEHGFDEAEAILRTLRPWPPPRSLA